MRAYRICLLEVEDGRVLNERCLASLPLDGVSGKLGVVAGEFAPATEEMISDCLNIKSNPSAKSATLSRVKQHKRKSKNGVIAVVLPHARLVPKKYRTKKAIAREELEQKRESVKRAREARLKMLRARRNNKVAGNQ